MNYIILWVTSFLFSIAFCYYTSDKSYYCTWWDKYMDSCSEETIEKNKKEFLKKQGRENITTKQRIKQTISLLLFSIAGSMGIFIFISDGPFLFSLSLCFYAQLMLISYTSIMGVLGVDYNISAKE